MGIEVASTVSKALWKGTIQTSELDAGFSARLNISPGNSEMVWLLLGVAFVFVLIGVIGVFRSRSYSEGDEPDEGEDINERIAHLERRFNRLTERTDALEERVRVEVTSLGRTLGTLLGRSEAVTHAGKLDEQAERPVSHPRISPDTDQRPTSSRSDLSQFAEIATSRPESVSLTQRLVGSRRGILNKIKSVFAGYPTIDADMLEELEVLLVTSDLGLKTASSLLRDLKATVREGGALSKEEILAHLRDKLLVILNREGTSSPAFHPRATAPGEPKVVFVVGVNGVGKTTTVAKLAHRWTGEGSRVVLAAADTFRAAADEQLKEWGRRVGVQVVTGASDDKPSTVAHAAVELARREGADVVLVDTAGRLHNRGSLMQELEGMVRAVKKLQPYSPEEVWLVIDGTTGQNALVQAREFQSSVSLTGVIVTKLDGSAKGGVVVAVTEDLGIPVRFIGVGETWDDLRPFDSREFSEALLGDGSLSSLDSS